MDRLTPRLLLALSLALAIAAGAAACGDDDDSDGDGGVVITVTTVSDDAARDGEISLREAIQIADGALAVADLDEGESESVDGAPGVGSADTIAFGDLGDDPVIALAEALPPLTRGNETLDAAGSGVTVDGSAADFVCFELASSNNTIYGLRITGCRTGIHVSRAAADNRIGGPDSGQGNVILDGVVGIQVDGTRTTVQGNHIGVEPGSAEARGNEFEGIWLSNSARDNTIGGPAEGEGNVISGNPLYALSIDGARGSVVQGNFFGLDTTGRIGVRNGRGVNVQAGAFNNLIGGPDDGDGNVISGNGIGILLTGPDTTGNTIQGNIFGKSAGEGEAIRNDEDIYEDVGVGENEAIDNVFSQ